MSEYRFISITDYTFRTNRSQNLINLPISPFHAAAHTQAEGKAQDDPTTDLNIPYTVFEILVAIVSVIGNLMVVIVFRRERKLRRRTNYYIVSLAIADLLVGSLGVPFAILASIGLPHNLHACLFTVSLLVVLCTTSIFCLVAVSVDRYWAILYPMAYSRNVRTRTAIVIISMCWVAGAIVGFLPLFGWHAKVEDDQKCLFVEVMDYNYLVFLYFATIITPALLMLAFYTHIYRVIIKQVRQIVTMNPASDLSRRSSTAQIQMKAPGRGGGGHGGTMLRVLGAARKRDVKATQNLSIIVLFFMICWIPLYTINCIMAFCNECYIHPKLTLFCIILSHLNSAVNPVLYAYHLKDFRAALKNLLLKLMGVDIDQQAEAIHRFSVASQHRLQSMDSNMRSTQPRMYVDSPIWLRQQQEALKNSQLLPKCGVVGVTPCLTTATTVAADIARDMWNIVEASSGAEIGEVSYEFPSSTKADSDKESSNLSVSVDLRVPVPSTKDGYSYDNHNYSTSSREDADDDGGGGGGGGADDGDDVEFEEVFVPQSHPVDPVELRRSLACVMREKLRSDDSDYQQHSIGGGFSDLDRTCSAQASPTITTPTRTTATKGNSTSNGGKLRERLLGGNSNSVSAIYVIDNGTSSLPSGQRFKYRKSSALTRTSRHKSRSCSCTSESASPPTASAAATSTPPPQPSVEPKQQQHHNHHLHLHDSFFGPLKSMGNFMRQPMGKHSNLFHIFHQPTSPTTRMSPTPTPPSPPPAAPLVESALTPSPVEPSPSVVVSPSAAVAAAAES